MRIAIPGTTKVVFLNVRVLDFDKAFVGLQSGINDKSSHYFFVDCDDQKLEVVRKEAKERMLEDSLKRILIVESSPKRYQLLAFSPRPFMKVVQSMLACSCDRNHIAHMLRDGKSTIRFTTKGDTRPKVIEELENKEGTNFYNFDAEKAYKELIAWSR